VTVWCSGREGSCAAGGLGFESRRPRSREIYAKNAGDGWALTGGGLHQLKKISIFLGKNSHFFGVFRFQLCRVSGTRQPTKDTRQRRLCRRIFCRVLFAECSTRQSLCRVQIGLCRVPLALSKASESGSDR
jgi:hypothetical protein